MAETLIEELRKLAALGYTAQEAAELTGRSWSMVRTYEVNYALHFISKADLKAARVVELAASGLSTTEIAAEVGTDRVHVYRILARQPGAPRATTKAQRRRAAQAERAATEEAARMQRWREAWASRKAAPAAPAEPAAPMIVDEASLGDAMRRLAAAERRRTA